jgi:hypothetical protein
MTSSGLTILTIGMVLGIPRIEAWYLENPECAVLALQLIATVALSLRCTPPVI